MGSIKLMLQNIGATYGFLNFSNGNPMYTKIADEYREANQVLGKPMSEKSFCVRFEIRNGYELFYFGNKFSISWRFSLVGLIQVDIISRKSSLFDEFNTMNNQFDVYYYNIAKSNFLNDEAYLYYDISDFKEGINSVTLALNIIPDDSGFLDTLALGYYYLENYELAIESSNRCIELDNINNSQNPEHYTTRAKINIKLNNLENASKDLKIAIKLDSDFEEATQLLESLK